MHPGDVASYLLGDEVCECSIVLIQPGCLCSLSGLGLADQFYHLVLAGKSHHLVLADKSYHLVLADKSYRGVLADKCLLCRLC